MLLAGPGESSPKLACAHRAMGLDCVLRRADLFFLGASIGEAQAHDGTYADHRVRLVHEVMQQCVGWVVLMLQPAVEDAHS